MSTTTGQQSRLLSLPPELRNMIYDLVFGEIKMDTPIFLACPRPPTDSLLHICRQIRHETKQMYRRKREHYWSTNHFFYNIYSARSLTDARRTIYSMRNTDLALMKQLQLSIYFPSRYTGRNVQQSKTLLDSRGLWKTETTSNGRTMLPESYRLVVSENYAFGVAGPPTQIALDGMKAVHMKDQALLMLQQLACLASDLTDLKVWDL